MTVRAAWTVRHVWRRSQTFSHVILYWRHYRQRRQILSTTFTCISWSSETCISSAVGVADDQYDEWRWWGVLAADGCSSCADTVPLAGDQQRVSALRALSDDYQQFRRFTKRRHTARLEYIRRVGQIRTFLKVCSFSWLRKAFLLKFFVRTISTPCCAVQASHLLYFIAHVRCRHKESSRSLSHLMSFLSKCYWCILENWVWQSHRVIREHSTTARATVNM